MRKSIRRFPPRFFIFAILMITSFSLAACASTSPENIPDAVDDQQAETDTKIMIPLIESSGQAGGEAEGADQAYPDAEQENQEEPIQEIKPTPRGNDLVATNPSTVKLASGGLQLVELFAFW